MSRSSSEDVRLKSAHLRPTVARRDGSMTQPPADVNRYLYEKIYAELKEEILSGKYKKGDWFPPERVLKSRFNTTHLTVRNALAKLVLEGYIERYSGKGTVVLYSQSRPPRAHKPLRFARAQLIIGAIDPANARLLESLEEQLRRLSIPFGFACHHGSALLEQGLFKLAEEAGDTLVILEPVASESSLLHSGDPLRNTIVVRGQDERFAGPQVVSDDLRGAQAAVKYLVDLGHREIGLLSEGLPIPAARLEQGYEEELARAGIPLDGTLVTRSAGGIEAGTAACARVRAAHADCRAFLCASDEIAAGAITCLRELGLRPGEDCAVIGYGNTPLAQAIGLTSVDPGWSRLGEQVMATVTEAMARGSFPEGVFAVVPELKLRTSCARAGR
jgi:GntR family transcriptional regulator, arabinose operon transcriptional repressor